MKDALKMIYLEKRLNKTHRKILVFADEEAKKPFDINCSKSWRAKCLSDFGIECKVGELRVETLERLCKAQKRQGQPFQKSKE